MQHVKKIQTHNSPSFSLKKETILASRHK